MSNDNNQANTRHHFVQKAYLDKFSERGKIDVINRQDGTVRPRQGTRDVANMRGLYTAVRDDGQKDGILEGAFATEIEGPAMKIINNMTSIFHYVPHSEERSRLAYYMALQYLRTLESKRRFELEVGRFASVELFNLANKPEKIKDFLQSKGKNHDKETIEKYQKTILETLKGYELSPGSNNMWLKTLTDGIHHIAPILVERFRWHLYYYDAPTFITSDHPVILRRINNDSWGIGFANADEVLFPLSKYHALILSIDDSLEEGVHINPGLEAAEMLNYFIMQNSYLEIYCPPSLTSNYGGQALGKRAIITMSGGDIEGLEFLKQYAGVLDREKPRRH